MMMMTFITRRGEGQGRGGGRPRHKKHFRNFLRAVERDIELPHEGGAKQAFVLPK